LLFVIFSDTLGAAFLFYRLAPKQVRAIRSAARCLQFAQIHISKSGYVFCYSSYEWSVKTLTGSLIEISRDRRAQAAHRVRLRLSVLCRCD